MTTPYISGVLVDELVIDSNLLLREREFLADYDSPISSRSPTDDIDEPIKRNDRVATSCSPTEDKLVTNIQRIIITAVVFVSVLTWFEFLRTLYDAIFNVNGDGHYPGIIAKRLAYAILVTAIAIITIYIIYRIATK